MCRSPRSWRGSEFTCTRCSSSKANKPTEQGGPLEPDACNAAARDLALLSSPPLFHFAARRCLLLSEMESQPIGLATLKGHAQAARMPRRLQSPSEPPRHGNADISTPDTGGTRKGAKWQKIISRGPPVLEKGL
jgi:hypothetical protein